MNSTVKSFDSSAMQEYAEDSDFSYMNFVVQPPTVWQRIQWWFQSIFSNLFSNPNTPQLFSIIFYGILFLVLGAAVFYIVRLKYGGAIASSSKSYISNIQSLDGIKQVDFDEMISDAVKDRNFKLAIRYIYLRSLSVLSQKELIQLKDWKSPFDYEKELQEEMIKPYKDLSQLFEYVWYGDFEATESDYLNSNALSQELTRVK